MRNLSPIDTAQPYYRLFDLDFLVRPDFEGGILRVDTTGYSYSQNFTLTGQAGNTLDTYGNTVVFSGTFSNVVAGTPGVLTVTNSRTVGSVTFSGANTFTGGLTINQNAQVNISAANNLGAESARLTLNGGTLNTGATAISTSRPVTMGALGGTINNTGLLTLGGVVDGSGTLTKNGVGTLTLTGNSSYSGTIAVNTGTLQIGNGGTTGSLSTGSIVNSTAVVFNRSDTSTYGGAISGVGSLTKQGAGTLILTGSNVHTGGTTISDGAMQIGNGGTTGSLAGNVTNNGLLIFNHSNNISFAGVISGTGAVSQSGSGILTLTGSNSYTGNTSFNNGVISVSSSANLGGATGNAMIFNSGTLNNTAAMSLARDVTLNSTGGKIDTGAALTLSGIISGSGLLTKIGANTLTLTGANTHTGGTTITSGTLQIGSGGTSGSITGNITNNAVLIFNRSDSSSYSGAISGSGTVTKNGAGTLTLSGNSSYTGGTAINTGILSIDNGNALGTGLVTNSATLNLAFASNSTLANTLTGTGALTKTGTGVATLTGGGTAGAVSVNAGTLTYNQAGVFTAASHTTASAAATTVNSGSRLAVTNGFTQSSGSTLNVALDGTAVARITAATANLAGTLNVSGFAGTPVARASEVADYKTLVLSTTGGITGDFSVVNDLASSIDYLTLTGYKTNSNKDYEVGFGLTWFAGTPKGNGVFTLANVGDTFDVDVVLSNQSAVAATSWDGHSLTKAGNGTLILSRTNTYTGATAVNGGILRAGIINAFAQSESVAVASGARLDLNNLNQMAQNLSGAGTITLGSAALTAQNSGNTVFSGVISGSGSLTKTGIATLTLSGANTYTGGTTISAGILQIGNGGASGSVTGNIVNNAALVFSRSDSSTYSGLISGSGTVTKSATGTLTLSGVNTYTGGTTVSAGTLIATSGNVLGTGTVTNNATLNLDFAGNSTLMNLLAGTGALTKTGSGVATLTGGGTAGAVSVNAGTLTYGQSGIFTAASHLTANAATTTLNAASRLAVTNAFTQNSGSTLSVALGGAAGARITAGTASLGGALNISGFTGAQAARASEVANSQAIIISTTGGLTGDFSSVNLGGAGSTVDYLTLAGYKTNGNKDYAVGFGLTWFAGTPNGNGLFTLTGAGDAFDVDVVLSNQSAVGATGWDGRSLTKAGNGTLILSRANTYTGATAVNVGTLRTGIINAFTQSSSVAVASGATLDLNGFNQIAQNLSGAGAITLGSGVLTAQNGSNTIFSGVVSGNGSLTKTGAASLTLSGANTYSGGTTISAGTLIATSGNALGFGIVTNHATLNLDFAGTSTLTNVLAGAGSLTKTGAGIATLTGGGSAGAVSVNTGTLAFGQSGLFTASSYTTANGAATTIGGTSQLHVTGLFTQAAGSVLNTTIGALNRPMISSNTANLSGTLNITGFNVTQPTTASALTSTLITVIHTDNGITGDFSTVTLGGADSTVDYLTLTAGKTNGNKDYSVGFGLTWFAGTPNGNGLFTLANIGDTFDVDVALSNQSAVGATSWDGRSLTKAGNGTLILSATNTYTGATAINVGTLRTGIINAFAQSSSVAVASGATLDLNGFNQIAQNLSGAGAITLGSGVLTAQNGSNTIFSGVISGSGSLTKTGAASLTLSGANTYTGGTTISAGTLIATSGNALGFGTVTNHATLNLDFVGTSTFANVLTGTGSLTKTGAGIATLTGGGSAGAVSVNTGTLAFGQSGLFTASSYTTANGAATTIGGTSQLHVTGLFTQAAGSVLNTTIGALNRPMVSANTANLSGTLNITGFTGTQPTTASALTSTLITLIHTDNGITGDFSAVTLDNPGSTVDYLTLTAGKTNGNKDYSVGFGLTWFAGTPNGKGTFTLANAGDTFDVDVVLSNQSAVAATSWDGRSLTKAGNGTLILSATNTYTGATTVDGGILRTGIINTFAQSSSVAVASGATLDLNGFNQIAQNLSGAGAITLGSGVLTAQNGSNTIFSGVISGSGSLTKMGAASLTLSGANTYSGGTTISAGTLIATSGNAFGSNGVANNATLNLAFATDSTLANVLSGTGALTKTDTGIATLTGGGSAGAVSVNTGTLAFGQSGLFTVSSYTTANGAATTLGGTSRLSVAGAFTQSTGSTLNINVGALVPPAISANTATLGGTLNITGFTGTQATVASTLLASQVNVIHSTNNIIGDFSAVSFAGAPSSHNYMMLTGWKSADSKDYNVGFGLSWLAGTVVSHGGFNLADASDVFNVDIALANQAASLTGWDGERLGKRGDGTLILSAANTYTGMTSIYEGTLQIGNGGTTGSVAGNIVNSAALVFNRSDVATYGGVISGSGSLTQAGSGTLVLTGAHTYTGATLIDSGILQAGATDVFATSSSMNVASGATLNLNNFNQTINNLSGEGFVTLGSAILTANNTADTVFAGMMTGAGNLVKTGTAALQLTNSNDVIGDVDVRVGQLALNQTGTLNATGDYTTRNGATTVIVGDQSQLTVGGVFTQEAGATLSVTVGSAPDIVADTAALDGALTLQGFSTAGGTPVKASDVVSGQTYTLIKTTNGITGDFVATPLQPSGLDYVLYEGSVSRDGLDYKLGFKLAWTDGGPVSSSGKFTLGSGTAFDVDVVLADQATAFSSGWDGKKLVKEGAGLLVLSAVNSYTGGTTINEGTLQVSSDANLGDASGDVTFNGGSLATTESFTSNRHMVLNSGLGTFDVANDTILTLTGDLTGAGGMIKTEIGKLILEGDSSYTGATVVDSGALIAGKANAFSAHSDHTIHLGAVLALQGYDQTVANLDNAGNLHIGSGDGSRVGGALTVTGTYTSNGGNLFLNTVLGGDGSLSDRLVVGAVEMGTQGVSLLVSGEYASATKVYITNVGGLGAKTAGNGIEIVHVMDPSRSAENAFILGTRVAAGAYDYALHQGGIGGASSDGNWYLRTVDVGYRPETVINGAVPQTISRLGLSMLGGYFGRDDEGFNPGEAIETEDSRCQDPVYARKAPQCLRLPKTFSHETASRAAWARLIGETGEASYGGKTEAARLANFEKHGASYTYTMAGFVAGMDLLRQMGSDGSSDIAGIYVGAGRITSDVRNIYGGGNSGSSTTDGYSVGAYWRHGWASGFYVDAALQGTYYGSIETKSDAGQKMNTHGWAILGSLEGGYQMKLSDGWTIEPQAQIIYQHGSVENSSDGYGRIKFHDTDQYYGRIGVRVQKEWVRDNGLKIQMFGRANLWHSFGPDAKTTFTSLDGTNPVTLGSRASETWAQFTLGLGGQLTRNTTVFVSGDYNLPLGDNKGYSVGGRVGMKVVW